MSPSGLGTTSNAPQRTHRKLALLTSNGPGFLRLSLGATSWVIPGWNSRVVTGRSPALILRTKQWVRRDLHADEAKMGKGPVSCPSCGHENPAGARFCNDCGAPLEAPTITPEPRSYTPRHLVEKILASQSALRGERKLVTILFADVVRSMELAERVDPEEWHRLLDRLFRILACGVHRYEGTINQYTGDGIMALFGAPIAHEDHVQRACAAALDLARELGALAEDVRRES